MKKLILLMAVAAAVTLSSCKKDWTCKCTDQGNNSTFHTIPDASLTDAKRTCDGFEYQIGGAYTNCSIE